MITINLQWLSLPFFAYAVYVMAIAIAGWAAMPKVDIGSELGIFFLVQGLIHAIVSSGIGALIVAAFRK